MMRGKPWARVPDDFFGMHINRIASNQPIPPQTPYLNVNQSWHRIWDNYTTWKLINTASGVYNWSRLDDVVNIAESHGLKIIYGAGCAPDHAAGSSTGGSQYNPNPPTEAAWIAWVTALVTRYAGRIHAYELWNEPNDTLFWNGTYAQMARLCQLAYPIIKSIDPNAIVVSPCPAGILSVPIFAGLLDAGMGEYCDVFAFHAYSASYQPEYARFVTENYRGMANQKGYRAKQLWNTESGFIQYVNEAGALITGHDPADAMTAQQGSSYVARWLLSMAGAADKTMYYTTDDWGQMKPVILDAPGGSTIQPAGLALRYIAGLIQGAQIGPLKSIWPRFERDGITKDGRRFRVVWTADWKTQEYPLAGLNVVSATDCRGTAIAIAGGSITATMEPTILFCRR
jgi:hypothetical protein